MIQLAMVSTVQGALFDDHRLARVRGVGARSAMGASLAYVSVCTCGWESRPLRRNAALFELDKHAARALELGAP